MMKWHDEMCVDKTVDGHMAISFFTSLFFYDFPAIWCSWAFFLFMNVLHSLFGHKKYLWVLYKVFWKILQEQLSSQLSNYFWAVSVPMWFRYPLWWQRQLMKTLTLLKYLWTWLGGIHAFFLLKRKISPIGRIRCRREAQLPEEHNGCCSRQDVTSPSKIWGQEGADVS